jgi:hypothetical protein
VERCDREGRPSCRFEITLKEPQKSHKS